MLTMAKHDPDIRRAKQLLERLVVDAEAVIKIMTAEEAIKAQRVIREAGKHK